jgi:hypothetical protein
MQAFLGFGLTRPFQRDLRSDFTAAGAEQLIRSDAAPWRCYILAAGPTPRLR